MHGTLFEPFAFVTRSIRRHACDTPGYDGPCTGAGTVEYGQELTGRDTLHLGHSAGRRTTLDSPGSAMGRAPLGSAERSAGHSLGSPSGNVLRAAP